jgi:hypothetical protein
MKTKLTLSEIIETVKSSKDYGTINPEAVNTKARYNEWSEILQDYVPTVKLAKKLNVLADSFLSEKEIVTADNHVIKISDWAGIPFLRHDDGMIAYIKM